MPIQIVIHGGAGVLAPGRLSAQRETATRIVLEQAVTQAYDLLTQGGSAADACALAVKLMEDCHEFNAGKGAVFGIDGSIELDAGIMDGRSGAAGAVTCVTRVRNPIDAARRVMETTPHGLLCSRGADEFARNQGLALVDSQKYFETELRWNQLQLLKQSNSLLPVCDHSAIQQQPSSQGTVGAVALDSQGNLVATSSTGGLCGKLPGRVSDSSIVGAGFWADRKVALSGTGNGDNFLRASACRLAADLYHYNGMNIQEACAHVVHKLLNTTTAMGDTYKLTEASAGMIAVDHQGNVAMPFNSGAMFRARMGDDLTQPYVAIFEQ